MKTLLPVMIGSAALTSLSVFHGKRQNSLPSLTRTAKTSCLTARATAGSPPASNRTGGAEAATPVPQNQITLPVILSSAAPALPAFTRARVPSISTEPAKPHVGISAFDSVIKFLDQITVPLVASRQCSNPRLLKV